MSAFLTMVICIMHLIPDMQPSHPKQLLHVASDGSAATSSLM
jgi:hypothetical protein